MRSVLALILTLAVASSTAGRAEARAYPPLVLAPGLDIPRMYGGWYIVATIPNGFEKGMVQPYDVYSERSPGVIGEDFYVRRGRLDARRKHFAVKDFVDGADHARWGVQIVWPLKLPFLVIHVDPDYRFALFGEENRSLGWIYARSPDISDADYARLLAVFAARGYDTSRFRKIVQHEAQVGAPGFWSDGIAAPKRF